MCDTGMVERRKNANEDWTSAHRRVGGDEDPLDIQRGSSSVGFSCVLESK